MRLLPLLLLGLSLAVSCSKKNSGDEIQGSDFFSERPQNNNDPETGRFITLVQLKTPALLSTSSKSDEGVTMIDPDEEKKLEAEQEEFIQKIKKKSDKIKILRRYKYVLNAVAVLAPKKFEGKLKDIKGVEKVEKEQTFERAEVTVNESVLKSETDLNSANSTTFIGANQAHALGIKGKGISVGILDTGIDYTHKMFGGEGTKEAFEAVDPGKEAATGYPNAKVVGGIDLVGTDYDASSPIFDQHIPKPDNNPIDEGGHGTHVAGSVAGIGDGVKTYNGVAPDATLHAIKVFGAKGSTGDTVIIAGLEYAVDPNNDGDLSDQLDIVNLSLGSGFGKIHSFYNEAVKNLVNGGTFLVASAGNSGHNVNIVGSPSIINEAFSIGASIDNMDHNVKFGAVAFNLPEVHKPLLAELIEGNISKPVSETDVVGKLVYVGEAATDFTDEQKEALKGNVALIDRGTVSFVDKLKRAHDAGALGVVVANNRPGDAIRMGGNGKIDLPAVMVTQAIGNKVKEGMKKGDVVITFKTDARLVKEELIDTLTGFSSRGPRFGDSGLKPEIAAPGFNIISAAMGRGDEAVQMSGTSMSAPHMAGVMALLVEKFPKLNARELKSLAMNTAKTMDDAEGKVYPIAMQGAGRVQVGKAINTKLIALPGGLSLGDLNIATKKLIRKKIELKNISNEDLTVSLQELKKDLVEIEGIDKIQLKKGESKEVTVQLLLKVPANKESYAEIDGLIKFNEGGTENEVARVPFLAVVKKISKISVEEYKIFAESHDDAPGSAVDLTLKNDGKNAGEALIFNLLGKDQRKPGVNEISNVRARACDLQSAGFRVIQKEVEGQEKPFLQFAIKLFNPVTHWQGCEISVLLDANGDGVAEQELVGLIHQNLSGLDRRGMNFNSFLLDAAKVRKLRGEFETAYSNYVQNGGVKPEVDYKPAILAGADMLLYNHSTISVIEADLGLVQRNEKGQLSFKLAVLAGYSSVVEADDFLGDLNKWKTIHPSQEAMSFGDIPEKVIVDAGKKKSLELTKGEGEEDMVIYFPQNAATKTQTKTDKQSKILEPNFEF